MPHVGMFFILTMMCCAADVVVPCWRDLQSIANVFGHVEKSARPDSR